MSKYLTALAFTLLLGGVLAADDKKDAKKPTKAQATAEGQIKSIDAKARTVTLYRPHDPNSKDVIVVFSADVTVFIDGKEGKFEDVPIGKDVHARVIGGKAEASRVTDATELAVIGRQSHGHVRKITTDSITYTPEGAVKNKLPDATVKFTPDLKVLIGGKEAKLTDIKIGEYVGLIYTADGTAVHTLLRTTVPMKK